MTEITDAEAVLAAAADSLRPTVEPLDECEAKLLNYIGTMGTTLRAIHALQLSIGRFGMALEALQRAHLIRQSASHYGHELTPLGSGVFAAHRYLDTANENEISQ